jgi:flagellar biosynthesis protein FliP
VTQLRHRFYMDGLFDVAARGHATLPLDVLASLTVLAIVPFLLMMCTSFVRIVVVLSLVRSAIGASALPS